MIIRVKHDTHYTVIRDKTLRDSRLSFRASGLLAYLLSLPDDAAISRHELMKAKTDGEHSVREGLKELQKAGYLERIRIQNPDGRWSTEVTVRECPRRTGGGKSPTGQRTLPVGGFPTTGFPPTKYEVPRRGATPPSPPPENLPSPDPITDNDRRAAARGLSAARAHLRTA